MHNNLVDINQEGAIPLVIGDDEHWVDYENTHDFIELVNPINMEFKTNRKTTVVKKRPISCYKDSYILKVEDKKWKESWAIFYFLYSKGEYHQLGHIDEDIYILNKNALLSINPRSVIDYLKLAYYFYAVDDLGSRFILKNKNDEFALLLPYSNNLEKNKIANKIFDAKVESLGQQSHLTVKCCMIEGDALYETIMTVDKKGRIEFLTHNLLHGTPAFIDYNGEY